MQITSKIVRLKKSIEQYLGMFEFQNQLTPGKLYQNAVVTSPSPQTRAGAGGLK